MKGWAPTVPASPCNGFSKSQTVNPPQPKALLFPTAGLQNRFGSVPTPCLSTEPNPSTFLLPVPHPRDWGLCHSGAPSIHPVTQSQEHRGQLLPPSQKANQPPWPCQPHPRGQGTRDLLPPLTCTSSSRQLRRGLRWGLPDSLLCRSCGGCPALVVVVLQPSLTSPEGRGAGGWEDPRGREGSGRG